MRFLSSRVMLFLAVSSFWAGAVSQAVAGTNELIGTSTVLTASPNAVTTGGSTTITVKVTALSGTAMPAGSVSVNFGSTVLFTLPITNGTGAATVSSAGYGAGVYGLTAKYTGSSTFAASTSSVYSVTLKSPVTVTFQASPSPVAVGQNVLLRSTVTATGGGGTPTGTVSFKVGTDVLATIGLSNGTATLNASSTGYPPGTYPIVAVYNGDGLHATGNSSANNVVLVSDVFIATGNTPSATMGSPYTETFSGSGGTGNDSWSITSGLSALQGIGMSFNAGGVLSGTPDANGSYPYTVQVQDTGTGETASAPFTLVVNSSQSNCGGTRYSVSGTVSYSGSKTGRIYVAMGSNCGGGTAGTSISAAGAFTIRGVPAGTYNLQAFMDTVGHGIRNAADPMGSTAAVTVSNSNLTGVSITLADPGPVTLSSGPQLQSITGFNSGAIAFFKNLTDNSVETATSYTMQWSTSSSFTSVAGSKTFPATGTHSNAWFVNGLTNGIAYYFRAYGTSGGTPVGPYSSVYGPVTIGAPTGGNAVTGAVTFSGTATGPLYVIFINQASNTPAVYIDYIANPASEQAYSVQVPSNTYQFAAILDQNNDGAIDAGDLQDVQDGNGTKTVTISEPTSNEDLTLPGGNGSALVNTQNTLSVSGSSSSYNYGLHLQVDYLAKLPVSVTLESSSNLDGANVVGPIDVANCETSDDGCGHGFQINYGLGASAEAGDTYSFNVTYSDGSTGTLTYSLPAALNAYATNLAPTNGTSSSTTPTFTWTDPANAADYTYQFNLYSETGSEIWQIPGNDSNANGFSSSITSIAWGTDPTGGGSTPSVPNLSTATQYGWQIGVVDSYGNQAFTQVNYQP